MEVFHGSGELGSFVENQHQQGHSIGFVPTMGALHRGHIRLVETALSQNDVVVVSIFVNPTQFNNPSDLEKYPRIPREDLSLLEEAGCHAAFMPEVSEMYPDGVVSQNHGLKGLDKVMEGEFRPGHFQGVATIVNRFFDLVDPDRAYFGEKDFQQLAIIRQINEMRDDSIEIVGVPTERESDGLAMSSRNLRLSPLHREQAPRIAEALFYAQEHYSEYDPNSLIDEVKRRIEEGTELEVEYISIADPRTLQPVSGWAEGTSARLFTAVFAGDVRLIDNVHLF